jgi:acylphosphatase
MLRRILCTLLVLVVSVGVLLAAEVKGKVKNYQKGQITVTVDGKDQDFKINKQTKIIKGTDEITGKERGKTLKQLKEGDDITIIYEKEGVAQEVKIK